MKNKDINECLKINIQVLREYGLINNVEDISKRDIKILRKAIENSECFNKCMSKFETKTSSIKKDR